MQRLTAVAKINIFILGLWYILMFLHSTHVISFGLETVSIGWTVFTISWLVALIVISDKISTPANLNPAFILLTLQTIVFDLAAIYHWYSLSPLVNRAEHIIGTLTACIVVYVLMVNIPSFNRLQPVIYKFIILIGIVAMLTITNELIELGLDFFLHTHTIGPDLWDTNLDLLMNTISITVFCGYLFYTRKLVNRGNAKS